MARTLAQIDRDIDVERAVWIMERRAGDYATEAIHSKRRLDKLLDERLVAELEHVTA